MNIDSVLNKIIKFLLVSIISIMLTIGFLFITPVSVHAVSNFYDIYTYTGGSSVPNSVLIDNGLEIVNNPSTPSYRYFIFNNTSGESVHNFYSYYKDGSSYYIAFFTDSNSGNILTSCVSTQSTNNTYNCTTPYYSNGTLVNSSWYQYTWSYNTSSGYNPVPDFYFESRDSAFSAFNDFFESNFSAGAFYNFPQYDDDTYITYEFVEGNGVMVYASPNTYHLMGTYASSSAPLSQYCYISNSEDDTSFAVFSSVPLTVYSAFMNGGTYSYGVCSQYDTNKYYYVFPETIVSNIEDSFDSLESAQAAFTGASSGQGAGVSAGGELTLQVPAGNVLYVRPRSGSLARLEVRYPYLSNSFGNAFPLSAYWLSGVSSLPDENTTFPLSGMSQINWSVDTSSVNGYGQSYNGYTSHAPFNAGWFVVYNPTYYYMSDTDGHNVNLVSPTITVKMQYASEYRIYDLSMNVISNTSTSNTDYDTSINGQFDDTTNQWNKTSTTGSENPSVGGQQEEIVEAQNFSVTEYLHQIRDTLSKFAADFVQLLSAPIVFISNLIESGSAFMSHIAQFFTWLPAPVYTLIVSALGVAVAIGIFKLLF